MRSSSEEALSQLNKWKSKSAQIFVSTTGLVTLWVIGKISRASSTEVNVELPGVNGQDCFISFSLRDARFEQPENTGSPGFIPDLDKGNLEFDSFLIVFQKNDKRLVFAELAKRSIDV